MFRLGCLVCLLFAAPVSAQDPFGYAALLARLGGPANTPNGSGVWVAQVEAGPPGNYAPDPEVVYDRPGFVLNLKSGPSTYFGHATVVANIFFGEYAMADGVTTVDAWQADHWLTTGFLSGGPGGLPPTNNIPKVSNHSYVGTGDNSYLLRTDYLVHHGGQIVVAAAGGGASPLIGMAPNAIAVGASAGGSNRPHLVAPGGLSFATPLVSAAAAVLVQTAGTTPFASDPRTIKAVLLAGATKTGLGGTWVHTPTDPLDPQFGAGGLNINNSHLILTAGRQTPGTAFVASTGWDHWPASGTPGGTRTYRFAVPEGAGISGALTWHRVVDNNLGSTLADLDFRLVRLDGAGQPIATVAESVARSGNVEHVWVPGGLSAGNYGWQVITIAGAGDYAVAWQVHPVPVPEAAWVLAAAAVVLAVRRVRRAWLSAPVSASTGRTGSYSRR